MWACVKDVCVDSELVLKDDPIMKYPLLVELVIFYESGQIVEERDQVFFNVVNSKILPLPANQTGRCSHQMPIFATTLSFPTLPSKTPPDLLALLIVVHVTTLYVFSPFSHSWTPFPEITLLAIPDQNVTTFTEHTCSSWRHSLKI